MRFDNPALPSGILTESSPFTLSLIARLVALESNIPVVPEVPVSRTRFASTMNRVATATTSVEASPRRLVTFKQATIGSSDFASLAVLLDNYFYQVNGAIGSAGIVTVNGIWLQSLSGGTIARLTKAGQATWSVDGDTIDNVTDSILPTVFGLTTFGRNTDWVIRSDINLPVGSTAALLEGTDAGLPEGTFYDPAVNTWQDSNGYAFVPSFDPPVDANNFGSPTILLGIPVGGDARTYSLVGDSIFAQGNRSSYGCVALKRSNMAGCQIGRGGASSSVLGQGSKATHLLKYCNAVIDEYGTNDDFSGFAGLKALALSAWATIRAAMIPAGSGIKNKIIRVPLLFRTTGSQSGNTTQTVSSGWGAGGDVEQFNSWLLSRVGIEIDQFIDPRSAARYGNVPGTDDYYKWLADYTYDGLHPNPAGAAALAAALSPSLQEVEPAFETYQRPFSARSLWNSKPVSPVLGDYQIPETDYFPQITSLSYSTGVFEAKESDPAVTITGVSGSLAQPDIAGLGDVTIPHFPASVFPGPGTDGHADIIDVKNGIVHSLYQLQKVGSQWKATVYAWGPLNGTGWGDPAHHYMGVRAAGVAPCAGLIRAHEINDGDTMYRHALAGSLDYSGLAANPAFVFPATAADTGAQNDNSGAIPEGALLMLPDTFDVMTIADPALRKVALTLKTYGVRIVDRNTETRLVIYSEIGGSLSVNDSGQFDGALNNQLVAIVSALRPVQSASSWIDGNGISFVPNQKLNLLSMRGPYNLFIGPSLGVYNTFKQRIEFPATSELIYQGNGNTTGIGNLPWAKLVPGNSYTVTSICTGGGKLKLSFISGSGTNTTTGDLANGQSFTFTLQADFDLGAGSYVNVEIQNGANGQASTVSGTLVQN